MDLYNWGFQEYSKSSLNVIDRFLETEILNETTCNEISFTVG